MLAARLHLSYPTPLAGKVAGKNGKSAALREIFLKIAGEVNVSASQCEVGRRLRMTSKSSEVVRLTECGVGEFAGDVIKSFRVEGSRKAGARRRSREAAKGR
jgi:hypothetical protein